MWRWVQCVVGEVLAGQVLTPQGWVLGRVAYDTTISRIEPDSGSPTDRFILPGFIDLHVHGGGGVDCMDGAASVRHLAAFHARHGTTSLLATTVTAPPDDLRRAAAGVGEALRAHRVGTARVLGMHLEGPFISPGALGAQPPFPLAPDLDLVSELCALAPIRVVTMAPEIDPDGRLLASFMRHGVRVQIGHTMCDYDQACEALARGASGFTHLFNAMTGLHHRTPGAVGCALSCGGHAEIIADMLHVSEGGLRVALRAVPGLYCVTDAVAAAGMPDGDYHLGRLPIRKEGGAVRLLDGGLAGSVLTMDQALRNLLALGLSLAEASPRLSSIAADYLGLSDRGRIAPGYVADMVVVDAAGRLLAVLAEGVAVSRGG